MKTKKSRKKLVLNKKTIADLGGKEMSGLKAGKILPTEQTCVTCVYTCGKTCNPTYCGGSCPCPIGRDDDPV